MDLICYTLFLGDVDTGSELTKKAKVIEKGDLEQSRYSSVLSLRGWHPVPVTSGSWELKEPWAVSSEW